MGSTIDKKIKQHIDKLTDVANRPNDKIKMCILANKFYEDNKAAFDHARMNLTCRKHIISSFILFVVQFETVCVKAFSPLSGSGDTSLDIIRLYSQMHRRTATISTSLPSE